MSTAPAFTSTARHVLLSGPPGSGKSTLAPALAARLGVEHTDLDASLVARFGAPISEQWRELGEHGFRARERAELARMLAQPTAQVIALGGGSLLERGFRHEVLAHHTVVALRATTGTLLARLRAPGAALRPALADDAGVAPVALASMLEARAEAYAEAHAVVCTDGSEAAAVDALARAAEGADLLVPLGARSYPVHLVDGGLERALASWCMQAAAQVALWVVDDGAYAHHRARFDALAAHTGAPLVVVPGGEGAKQLTSVGVLWQAFADSGVSRAGVVAIAGGGAVLDSAAFAVSCWHRGTAHVLVPTTLIGMADAAVGGKTAVNLASGKNLVGSTWQPRAVFVDCMFLGSNPIGKWQSDQAEVLKAAALGDAALVDELSVSKPPGSAQVRRALRVKVALVAADELDRGERALLNLGHTVGHALEVLSGFTLSHGEAVAMGMRAELGALVRLGHCDASVFAELEGQLDRLGFVAAPADLLARRTELERLISGDKKAESGELRLCALARFGDGVLRSVGVGGFCEALRLA